MIYFAEMEFYVKIVNNHLKIRIVCCVFKYVRMSPFHLKQERVLFHRVCHVSTVALNGQTKHWLYQGHLSYSASFAATVSSP